MFQMINVILKRVYGPLLAATAGVALILLSLLIKSLIPDPSFSTYYDPNFHDLTKEARIGSEVLLREDWKKTPLFNGHDKVLVALMGGCQSCSRNHYNIGTEPDRKFSEIVFVFDNPASEFDKATKSLPSRYRAVADPKQILDHQLNAEWYPRLYVATGDGKLIAAQSPKTTVEQFLRRQF